MGVNTMEEWKKEAQEAAISHKTPASLDAFSQLHKYAAFWPANSCIFIDYCPQACSGQFFLCITTETTEAIVETFPLVSITQLGRPSP